MTAVVRVAEIRAREKAATEGPWACDLDDFAVNTADTRALVLVDSRTNTEAGLADLAFVAHAREDVPFLLARLDEANETLREVVGIAENPAKPRNALDGILSIARAFLSGGDTTTKETT